MKVPALSTTFFAVVAFCAMQAIAAPQQSTLPPTTVPPISPQGRSPQGSPPPGTQDDRQVPGEGSNRNSPPPQAGETGLPGAGQSGATKGNFAERAALRSLAAIRLGQLAQSNSVNSEIRDLGRMLVDDNQDTFGKLSSGFENGGINIGSQLDAGDQAVYDRLAKLSGDVFDREFAAQAIKNLEEAITEYQNASAARDGAWRTFAAQYLPTLRKELEKAETISQSQPKPQAAPTPNRTRRPLLATTFQSRPEERS